MDHLIEKIESDGMILAECRQLDQQAVTAAIQQCGRHLSAACKYEVKILNKMFSESWNTDSMIS